MPQKIHSLPAKVNLMYNNREPRFYASRIAYNGSVLGSFQCLRSPIIVINKYFIMRGLNDGKQDLRKNALLTGNYF